MDMLQTLSLFIGICGVLLTVVGAYLTYISFADPIRRLKKLVKNPDKWERVQGTEPWVTLYRHCRFSQYAIEVNDSETLNADFNEDWLDRIPAPNPAAWSQYVRVYWGGSLLTSEVFVGFDGGRYFLPLPRIDRAACRRTYFITTFQLNLAHIVGRSDLSKIEKAYTQTGLVKVYDRRDLATRLALLLGTRKYSDG